MEAVTLLGAGVAALALVWGALRWRGGPWGLPQLLPLSGEGNGGGHRGVSPPWSWRLRGAAVFLLGLHLAVGRPSPSSWRAALGQAEVVVVLALDVSASMGIRDMGGESRLDAARHAALGLLRRTGAGSRIGLVIFGRQARTLVPPTAAHRHVARALEGVEASPREEATALGEGVGLAVHRAVQGAGSRRAVVVLTDGRSNAGAVDPSTAAAWARSLGVRVYAVGVGGVGGGEPLAEAALERLAVEGGGAYFPAADTKRLAESLRKVEKEVGERGAPQAGGAGRLGGLLLGVGVGCLLLEGVFLSRRRERLP